MLTSIEPKERLLILEDTLIKYEIAGKELNDIGFVTSENFSGFLCADISRSINDTTIFSTKKIIDLFPEILNHAPKHVSKHKCNYHLAWFFCARVDVHGMERRIDILKNAIHDLKTTYNL